MDAPQSRTTARPDRSEQLERPGRVHDAMLTTPVTHPPTTTIAQAREALVNTHRHLLLIVSAGRLLGTVARDDLETPRPDTDPALTVARLTGRTVRAEQPLDLVLAEMSATGRRRSAVVDADGRLLGLLCLKARGGAFCTDEGVAARAGARAAGRRA